MILVLDAEGITVPVGIQDESTFVSRHTGRTLRRVRGEVVAVGEDRHKQFEAILEKSRKNPLPEHENSPGDRAQWMIARNSYSYTQSRSGDPEYRYSVTLEEFESLQPERVEVGPLSLRPTKYEEEFSDDALLIRMVVLVSGDEKEALLKYLEEADKRRGVDQYFPVRRPGISDEVRQMRFGQTWWSEHSDGNKYSLNLIEASYDTDSGKAWRLNEQHDNAASQLAFYVTLVNGMLDALVKKGVMTQDQRDALEQEAKDQHWRRVHRFYQIEDADRL